MREKLGQNEYEKISNLHRQMRELLGILKYLSNKEEIQKLALGVHRHGHKTDPGLSIVPVLSFG